MERHLLRLSSAPLLFALALGASACADPAPPPPAASAPADDPTQLETSSVVPFEDRFDSEGRYIVNTAVLPAWRPSGPKAALKADEYDDIRDAAPHLYAITEPPTNIATVRPMAEWEPMRAIVMSYPAYMLSSDNATDTFVQIAYHSVDEGEVWFIVDGNAATNGLKGQLLTAGVSQATLDAKVKFVTADIDSVWFIDSGPLPIIDTATSTFAFADWRYYHERPLDDGVPTFLGRNMASLGYDQTASVYRMPLDVEGGTLQATTTGICFTSDRQIYNLSCYDGACDDDLNYSDLTAIQTHPYTVQMEATLAQYAGCKDLVITHSITDDGTGHIDMYMKVLDDHAILIGEYVSPTNSEQQENKPRLDANAAFLEAYVLPDGSHFTVHRIPMPGHRNSSFGKIPFTYINSTFFNGVNLWPYSDYSQWSSSKTAAQAAWEAALPAITHIPIESTELSFYSGAVHCVTRTIPALPAADWVADGACAGESCTAPPHGYAGSCSPGGISEEVCWGPAWLCDCNDCESGCASTPNPCGDITSAGCCDGSTVYYCESGAVYNQSCGMSGCGWDNNNEWYDCGFSGADPSGDHPKTCGATCVPQCNGAACGDDGCGGSCGSCGANERCDSGACVSTCTPACTLGASGCDGQTAWTCVAVAGCETRESTDCAARGERCEAGACVAQPVEPEPDTASPDTASPLPDTATPQSDATNLDVNGGGDTQTIGRKRDDGCAGGPAGTSLALLAAFAAVFALRRRALAR